MSMQPQPISPVPEETARVAKAAFPKGSTYMQMRDVLGAVYEDTDFSGLFAVRGRPAHAPWRLALVTVMQFAEGLSDRQAAQAVRARIDWKYALGLELGDAGFEFYALSEFRSRLVEGGSEQLLLDTVAIGQVAWSVQGAGLSEGPRQSPHRLNSRTRRSAGLEPAGADRGDSARCS